MRPVKIPRINDVLRWKKELSVFAKKRGLTRPGEIDNADTRRFYLLELRSLFAKDPWIGKLAVKAFYPKEGSIGKTEQVLLHSMRRHLIKSGKARNRIQADKIIKAKVQQYDKLAIEMSGKFNKIHFASKDKLDLVLFHKLKTPLVRARQLLSGVSRLMEGKDVI